MVDLYDRFSTRERPYWHDRCSLCNTITDFLGAQCNRRYCCQQCGVCFGCSYRGIDLPTECPDSKSNYLEESLFFQNLDAIENQGNLFSPQSGMNATCHVHRVDTSVFYLYNNTSVKHFGLLSNLPRDVFDPLKSTTKTHAHWKWSRGAQPQQPSIFLNILGQHIAQRVSNIDQLEFQWQPRRSLYIDLPEDWTIDQLCDYVSSYTNYLVDDAHGCGFQVKDIRMVPTLPSIHHETNHCGIGAMNDRREQV